MINLNTLNAGLISVAAGYVGYLVYSPLRAVCLRSTSDFFCLRVSSFFNPGNIDRLLQINIPNILIESVLALGSDSSLLNAKSCSAFARAINQKYTQIQQIMHQDPISYFARCCVVPNLKQTALLAFGEELFYRKFVQNWVLLKCATLLPQRYRKIATHPVTRIFLTSALFALNHYERGRPLLPEFAASFIYGAVYEKYGLIGSSAAHAVTNLYVDLFTKNSCDTNIPSILRALKGKEIPQWSVYGAIRCIANTGISDLFGISKSHPCAYPS